MIKIKSVIYFYQGQSVYTYCKKEKLSYSGIISSIKYYRKKDSELNLNETIEFVIERSKKRKEYKKIQKLFEELEQNVKINLSKYARQLNMNYQDLIKIKNRGYNEGQAIKILWLLSDKYNKKNQLSISFKRLNEMEEMKKMENVKNPDLLFLICYIKIGYVDFFENFLEQRQNYFKKLIYRYIEKYDIDKKYYYDLNINVHSKQWEIFFNCSSRHLKQLIKYYNLCLKGYIIKELKRIKQESCQVYLFDKINENQTYNDILYYD